MTGRLIPTRQALLIATEPDVSLQNDINPESVILVQNLRHSFAVVEMLKTAMISPYFGTFRQSSGPERSEIRFDHPLTPLRKNRHADLLPPRWDRVMRACGFSSHQTRPQEFLYQLNSHAFHPVELNYYYARQRHRSGRCLGEVEFVFAADSLPVLRFDLLGIPLTLQSITDTRLQLNLNHELLYPSEVTVSLDNQPLTVSHLSIKIGNQLELIDFFNHRQVMIADRKVEGRIQCLPTPQLFQHARDADFSQLNLAVRYDDGSTLAIALPRVQLNRPAYREDISHVELDLHLAALSQRGDDELTVTLTGTN